jgi:broad specificity phosphatase PhoE
MADENTNGQVVAYIVRHGSTIENEQHKFRGQLNIPLDEKGRQDAKDVAKFLSDKPIGQAWTSDLSRSKDTAKEILKGRGIKAAPLTTLRPLDSGKFAGKSKDEYKSEMDYYEKHPSVKIPGGESLENLHKRARQPILKSFRAGIRTGKPSLVVAHSSIIHTVGELLHGDHEAALVEPGGVVKILFDGKRFHANPVFKAKEETAEETKQDQYAS